MSIKEDLGFKICFMLLYFRCKNQIRSLLHFVWRDYSSLWTKSHLS